MELKNAIANVELKNATVSKEETLLAQAEKTLDDDDTARTAVRGV